MGTLERVNEALRRPDLLICGHLPTFGDIEPWFVCPAHLGAGVMCGSCWLDHLLRNMRPHLLRPCDICGEDASEVWRKHALSAPIVARTPRGLTRMISGVVVVEILCSACDEAVPFVEQQLRPARPIGDTWPYGA